jgi:hypothetical protein
LRCALYGVVGPYRGYIGGHDFGYELHDVVLGKKSETASRFDDAPIP